MSTPAPSPRTCPTCGVPLPAAGPAGQCPKCLFKLGFAADAGADRPPPAASAENPLFGNYRLKRQIGRGGMGVVYEAEHVLLRRPVALKVILNAELASPLTRRRFTIEAEAAARLDHPHIAPIYEVGDHDGQPFISMKLVEGESLRRKMARGDFRIDGGPGGRSVARDRQMAGAALIAALARAVEHAHQRGVLHRDLKPGNILIDQEGQPFVTDFGLAKLTGDDLGESTPPALTVSGTVIGTPDYMSPEQARGRHVAAATDIYSLGAMLYELLTGRPPFHAPTPVETMRAVVEQTPLRPRAVHRAIERDLETICLKCLEKEPRARYRTAAALAEDLERWLRREPIHARPAGPLLHMVRWVKRNPVGTALILSLLLGLGLTLGLLTLARDQQAEADRRRAVVLQQQWNLIEAELSSTNTAPVPIRSEILSVLGNYRHAEDRLGTPRRFVLSVSAAEAPVQVAKAYVAFLKLLEREMAERLDRPVLLDLVLKREFTPEIEPLISGTTDFQRMGLLPYLLARERTPGVQLVVREDVGKKAVIFVRQELYDRGVTNLARLAGRSVAFGRNDSTVNLVAKVFLARAGVGGTNLSRFSHISSYDPQTLNLIREVQRRTGQTDVMPVIRHNRETLRAVLEGGYDAGVVRDRYFETEKRKGLVALETFEIPPDVFVARAGLDPAVVEALRASLLALEDPRLLADLPLQGVVISRFVPAADSDFAEWNRALTNEAASFEPAAEAPALRP